MVRTHRNNIGVPCRRSRVSQSTTPVTEKAWKQLSTRLAGALRELAEDEFLVVSHKSRGLFVQFASHGPHGMRAEAASNAYLPDSTRLTDGACERLIGLGWLAPTYVQVPGVREPAHGSPNFYIDVAPPIRRAVIASLANETLRSVYGVFHPAELQYDAYGDAASSIRFPTLGLKRRAREPVTASVEYSLIAAEIERSERALRFQWFLA